MTESEVPSNWVWAYHSTMLKFIPSIQKRGLLPERHRHVDGVPVIFVEPALDGITPYMEEGVTAALRFKTPGFGTTDDGETVIYSAPGEDGRPQDPLVGKRGQIGHIPPERIQTMVNGKWYKISKVKVKEVS